MYRFGIFLNKGISMLKDKGTEITSIRKKERIMKDSTLKKNNLKCLYTMNLKLIKPLYYKIQL